MTSFQLVPLHEIASRWNKQIAFPLDIDLIDEIIGGLIPSQLHIVVGDSGVGKTWFCLKAIFQILTKNPQAHVVYNDFRGNFRINNLRKMLSNPCEQLDQITIFQPTSLLEQIIFVRNLLEISDCSFDLIVLDSVFGSPLTCLEYFYKKSKFWNKKIFAHLLDLQTVARQMKIPILLTNHLISTRENFELGSSLNQYGGDLVEQFVPIMFSLKKIAQKLFIELRIFQEIIDHSDLFPPINES
ncbi:MAG: hypothetical protein JSW11_05340 [Candidatus Heimdallarchaeota archaeon]|nr:MAG: hypothetical protein JSW11_05340 [Candidatus Heimdallarchaeota archaeon]